MADQLPPVVEEPRGSLFSNIVAVVGLIILVVVVIWGLLHLVGLSQGWLANLFNRTPQISVTAPKEVNVDEPFTISWRYNTAEQGNYAFLYQCKNGLTLKSADIEIPCGTSYTIGTATTLTFTPILTGIASTSMPINIVFLPNATSSERVQGSANIFVKRPAAPSPADGPTPTPPPVAPMPQPTPTPTPQPTSSPTPTPSVSAAPADLAVRIIALGIIDRYTGMFVNRAPMYFDDIAAVQFDITNVGGTKSGTYYFSAHLPTAYGYVYNSPAQTSLNPGDHMVNTLRWTNSAQVGTFTVALSGDKNGTNDFASATISSGYYQTPTYNNYYSQPIYYQQYTY